jgi:hypothetical protein
MVVAIRGASRRVIKTYTHPRTLFGVPSRSAGSRHGDIRRCAESLTAEERETLAQAAATLPADWIVEVSAWELVTAVSVRVPQSEFPIADSSTSDLRR